MKELSTEEKAQRYDEAIEMAKSWYIDVQIDFKKSLETLFPELKESEGEKIRNGLIGYFRAGKCENISSYHGISTNDILAWLEKQGEQKPYPWKPTKEQFEALDYAYNSCSDTERGNYYEGVLETLIEDLHRLEKQENSDIINVVKNDGTYKDDKKQGEQEMKEALHTEYEKGRADAIAEIQKGQMQEYLEGVERVQNYEELTKFEKGFDRIADTYAHRKNKDGYNKPWYTKERAAEMLYWAKEELGIFNEQVSADSVIKPKFKVGDTIVEKDFYECGRGTIKDIKDGKYIFTNGSGININEQNGWLLVKTTTNLEQKTTDNVIKPKFKIGDWITDGYDVGGQITSIEDNYTCYKIVDFMGGVNTSIPFTLQDNYHLWTLEDAKEGDMLSDETDIFIFKDLLSDDSVMSYCNYDTNSGDFYPSLVNLTCSKITPATKKQRNTLFAKMKEADYEWDAEKKELRKIEKKNITDEWVEDYWQHKKVENPCSYNKGEEIQFDHQGFVRFCKKYCQKHTEWGEEDDEMWIDAIKYLEFFDAQGIHGNKAVPCINWLKSLKEKILPQPKQKWDEENERLFNSAIWHLRNSVNNGDIEHSAGQLEDWLKSLKKE